MDLNVLNRDQKWIRVNVRNFLISATIPELKREKRISLESGDKFRAECIQELIEEHKDFQEFQSEYIHSYVTSFAFCNRSPDNPDARRKIVLDFAKSATLAQVAEFPHRLSHADDTADTNLAREFIDILIGLHDEKLI